MSRYYSHINTALKLLQSYKGEMPFSIFIKQFFSQEKKYGSKDRKQIAALCYSYFRIGLALGKNISSENLLLALFLTGNQHSILIEQLKPEWSGSINKPVDEKIKLADPSFNIDSSFPFKNELNKETDIPSFIQSFFLQPGLFVRTRPQHKKEVIEKIKNAGVEYQFLNNNNCIQFSSGTNVEQFLMIDKEVVIQDFNSQQVLNYLIENNHAIPFLQEAEIEVWDCCAASGGKSILINDLLQQKIKLTVSDIRQSTIANLQKRFKNAGIKQYEQFVEDISNTGKKIPAHKYDIIICDAPCTGSGTWSRTPEQLYFFNPSVIDEYAVKQKKIAAKAMAHLKKDGLFFYITCSVFKKENEDVVDHLIKQENMQLLEMKNLYGHKMQADSMFVAVFKKTN